MGWTRAILAAALLCAVGCQHGPALRAANSNEVYTASARETDRSLYLSDTRRVSLEFVSAPLHRDIQNDMVFAYLSLPLHPIRGIEFDNPSIGAGWSNTAMYFTNVFAPFSARIPDGSRGPVEAGEFILEDVILPSSSGQGPTLGAVDARHAAYAAALRQNLHRMAPGAGNDVLARSGGGTGPAEAALIADDD